MLYRKRELAMRGHEHGGIARFRYSLESRLLDSNPTVTARAFLSMSPESEDGSGIAIRWGMVAGFPGSGAL